MNIEQALAEGGVRVHNSMGKLIAIQLGDEYVCAKNSYIDQITAEFAVLSTRRGRQRKKDTKYESRVYHCQKCGKWHVTSQPGSIMGM